MGGIAAAAWEGKAEERVGAWGSGPTEAAFGGKCKLATLLGDWQEAPCHPVSNVDGNLKLSRPSPLDTSSQALTIVAMPADYFPLKKGAQRVFAISDASRSGMMRIEVLAVTNKGGAVSAKCRRLVEWRGKPAKATLFTVTKDAKGVRSGREVEFAAPIAIGTRWTSAHFEYWIESLDAAVRTPAGEFTDCLRVAYLIAGGDSGSGERFYAPGVGLVKVVEAEEGDPFE